MNYKVEKINVITGETYDMGTYDIEDVKLITRGYQFNGFFYERKNSNYIYLTTITI